MSDDLNLTERDILAFGSSFYLQKVFVFNEIREKQIVADHFENKYETKNNSNFEKQTLESEKNLYLNRFIFFSDT